MGNDARGSFQTHANYLRAFSQLALGVPTTKPGEALTNLAHRIEAQTSPSKLERKDCDVAQVYKSLANAWGTELLLALSGKYASEDELLRLVNSWGVVQLYYVFYHAAQALVVASGGRRPETHLKTRRMFNDRWVTKPIDLPPWSIGCSAAGFRNLNAAVDDSIHSWTICSSSTCWSLAAKALRTTWEDAFRDQQAQLRQAKQRERRQAWEAVEKERARTGKAPRKKPVFSLPTLTAADKETAAKQTNLTGLMDYMWRLRIRANYRDATMLTDGPASPVESRGFHRDLVGLAASTLLLHELSVCRLIGPENMNRFVTNWLRRNLPGDARLGLGLRRALILT